MSGAAAAAAGFPPRQAVEIRSGRVAASLQLSRWSTASFSVELMVHRQLFNALVELALQIVFLVLRFLLLLPQALQLVFTLRDLADVALDELFLLIGLAQRAQVLAHSLLISGDRVYFALLL